MAIRTSVGEIPSGLALDAQALNGLREQAKTAPGAALKNAATQFEGLFLSMLLKSMRDAVPKDDTMDSDATRSYTEMLDQQLAMTLAKKGTGLGDVLVKQLSASLAAATNVSSGGGAATATDPANATAPAAPGTTTPATTTPATTTPASGAPAADTRPVAQRIQSFVDRMRPQAQAASQATGVPVNFLIGQAALETGWGKSTPTGADGTASHNLFGIKAGDSWKGASVSATTVEYVNNKPVQTTQKFRAYGSYTEAFADFAKLISNNPRYAKALAGGTDPAAYAQGLQQGGYATDPTYAAKLQSVIQKIT